MIEPRGIGERDYLRIGYHRGGGLNIRWPRLGRSIPATLIRCGAWFNGELSGELYSYQISSDHQP